MVVPLVLELTEVVDVVVVDLAVVVVVELPLEP